MMRETSIPVDSAQSHRLFAPEVDAMLGFWNGRMFDQPGMTISCREDNAALDTAMPIAVHPDMNHFGELRRLRLVVWDDVAP